MLWSSNQGSHITAPKTQWCHGVIFIIYFFNTNISFLVLVERAAWIFHDSSQAHSWERICTSCSCWDYTLPKRDDFIDSTLVRKIVLLVRTDASHNHFFLVCPPNKNRYMLNAFLSGSWLKQMFFLHFSAGKSRCIGRVFSFCIFYWVKLLNLGVSFVGLFWSDVTHVDKYKKLWGQFIYTLVIVKLCLKFFDNDKITMFVHA